MRKDRQTRAAAHLPRQRRAIDGAGTRQVTRQGNRLAVMMEIHQHGHVMLLAADAHLHAKYQAVQHMGHVKFAIAQLVAHAGPRRLAAQFDLDAVLFIEAQNRRHDQRGAIGQRQITDPDQLFFRPGRPAQQGAAVNSLVMRIP